MTLDTATSMDWPDFQSCAPDVVDALLALGKAVDDAGIDKQLSELVKLRASQVNGCAFCLQLHLNAARKAEVLPRKIDLLPVWREVDIYTPRERAALAWTETLARPGQDACRDAALDAVQQQFSAHEVAYLAAAIAGINAWNRIAWGLRFSPPRPLPSR